MLKNSFYFVHTIMSFYEILEKNRMRKLYLVCIVQMHLYEYQKRIQDSGELELKVDFFLEALMSSSANKRIVSFCNSFINNGYLHKSKNV